MPEWRATLRALVLVIEADDRTAGDIGFFNDWVSHTQRDDYWFAIDSEDRPRRLKA